MKQKVAIVGGGPSALMLAHKLNANKYQVHLYEQNQALGRKFLVAGDGGLNLSHAEDMSFLANRYTPTHFLKPALDLFNNTDLRNWFHKMGIPTYVGSSNRIFPEADIKPIEVLNAITNSLEQNGVQIHIKHTWQGWQQNKLLFKTPNENILVTADIIVFALGGGSWSVTGSNSDWFSHFKNKNINVLDFEASNCAFRVNWNKNIISKIEGQALKNITLTCNNSNKKGEVIVTQFGLEGGAIYALSPQIREQIKNQGFAEVFIDFKPMFTTNELLEKIKNPSKNTTWTYYLQKQLVLNKTVLNLLKTYVSKDDFLNPEKLINQLKHFKIIITHTAPLDEAISSTGGIDLNELNENYELNKIPNHYCIGEMLNWDAPTGGYLLQGCFSMGYFLAKKLNEQ